MNTSTYEHLPDRIALYDENNKEVACVTFVSVSDQVIDIEHTFVDDSLRGQGIAGKLMEEIVKELQSSNKKAKLSCSYAVSWFEKRPEYKEYLA